MKYKHAHSPLPWESVYPEGSKQRCAGVVSNDHYVYLSNFDGDYTRETITMQQANADLIAKVANAHATLVAALKEMVAFGEEVERNHLIGDEGCFWPVEKARAVLKELGE